MERYFGTVARGIRGPILNAGDDIAEVIADLLPKAAKAGNFTIQEKDILCITESVVARCQNNYASVDQIAKDLQVKFGAKDGQRLEKLGLVFPITSRNRFGILLRAMARAAKQIELLLSWPSDEVGNTLLDPELAYDSELFANAKTFDLSAFRKAFGTPIHPFTGIDYISYYQDLCKEENCELSIFFGNDASFLVSRCENILACDIHTRFRTVKNLKKHGAKKVLALHDILNESVDGSGFNPDYGLLGSNKATEERVKLFPRNAQELVERVQAALRERCGVTPEVMVYGDGAFKDPVGKIWELADPIVSPGFSAGLKGTPHELKLKYLADNKFSGMSAEEQKRAIIDEIHKKGAQKAVEMQFEGTTPRNLTDLLGSLSDLISGSGDRGTPFVYIQGYFDNYASE